jgi:hypothetical protein
VLKELIKCSKNISKCIPSWPIITEIALKNKNIVTKIQVALINDFANIELIKIILKLKNSSYQIKRLINFYIKR